LAPATKARILVIDDEPAIAQTLAVIFRNVGFDARAVLSAESALELVDREDWIPQAALIDILLPGMNGIDLAVVLEEKIPGIQLVLLSGQAATAELLHGARLKGYDFEVLPKPVHPSELIGRVSNLVSNAS
jgi:DNA-binding response OmpR family regulator